MISSFAKDLSINRARGPLRESLTADQAAETYSALANPDLYLLLTTHHGWTADHYQAWLATSLQHLLLPGHETQATG